MAADSNTAGCACEVFCIGWGRFVRNCTQRVLLVVFLKVSAFPQLVLPPAHVVLSFPHNVLVSPHNVLADVQVVLASWRLAAEAPHVAAASLRVVMLGPQSVLASARLESVFLRVVGLLRLAVGV